MTHLHLFFTRLFTVFLLLSLTACVESGETPPSASRRPVSESTQESPPRLLPPGATVPSAPEAYRDATRAGREAGMVPPMPESPAAAPAYRKVKIALLVPLSGQHADLGRAMLDAAQLALYDKYATLTPPQKQQAEVILLPKDTKGTPGDAAAAASQAVNEGADLVLGPVFTTALRAAAPAARAKGVDVISFSNDKSAAGDGVFVMGFTPEEQVERALRYASRQGAQRFAALLPSDAYGAAVERTLARVVADMGGEVVDVRHYNPASPELYTEIRTLFGIGDMPSTGAQGAQGWTSTDPNTATPTKRFDALLIPEGGARLHMVAEAFAAYGIDPHDTILLGSGQWDDNSNPPPASLQGAWFVSAAPAQRDVFTRHFEKSYGYKPPRLASLAYDSTALAATLAFDTSGRDFSTATLTDAAGFSGPVDGIFRFLPDGQCQRGLAVLEVAPNGFSVIDPAPEYF